MKRNTLTTAVLAGLTGMAGMVSVSNAVNVNPDGLGQVLLYPYYSARGDNATLISIVNTTERGKAVKIRFIEALNSREVLDFNIYMSPFDVWTAGVLANDDGGAKMVTSDQTCTVPYFAGGDGEQDFLTIELDDGGPADAERTMSGYIEVIEMGTLLPTPNPEEGVPSPADESYIAHAVKHVGGVPNDCDHLVDQWTENLDPEPNNPTANDLQWVSGLFDWGFDTEIGPSGGLFGAGSIINVEEGVLFSYNATPIDGFWTTDHPHEHTDPASLFPNLADGNEDISNVFAGGAVFSHDWSGAGDSAPVAAVNAVLMYNQVLNEYVTEPDAGARTEWVMTFPTKRFHTDAAGGLVGEDQPVPPFTSTWNNGTDLSPACEVFAFTTPEDFDEYFVTTGSRAFDREERPDIDPPELEEPRPPVVSPPIPDDDDNDVPDPTLFQLCREANVVRFSLDEEVEDLPAYTEILKEPQREGTVLGYSNFDIEFDAGWVRFDLAEIGTSGDRRRTEPGENINTRAMEQLEGLPVIGFAVSTFANGELASGVLSNYGGTFNHRGSRSIVEYDDLDD